MSIGNDIDSAAEDFQQLADIRNMELNMTDGQKLRAAALVMAIRYHTETIIKDPAYLQLMMQKEKEAKFSNDPDAQLWHLKPTTVDAVIHIAQSFEAFLLGQGTSDQAAEPGRQIQAAHETGARADGKGDAP